MACFINFDAEEDFAASGSEDDGVESVSSPGDDACDHEQPKKLTETTLLQELRSFKDALDDLGKRIATIERKLDTTQESGGGTPKRHYRKEVSAEVRVSKSAKFPGQFMCRLLNISEIAFNHHEYGIGMPLQCLIYVHADEKT